MKSFSIQKNEKKLYSKISLSFWWENGNFRSHDKWSDSQREEGEILELERQRTGRLNDGWKDERPEQLRERKKAREREREREREKACEIEREKESEVGKEWKRGRDREWKRGRERWRDELIKEIKTKINVLSRSYLRKKETVIQKYISWEVEEATLT